MFDRHIGAYIRGRSYKTLLDMGSGRGNWLVYADKGLKLKAVGVDYSPADCQLARANLARSGVQGTIINADFFLGLDIRPVDVIYLGGAIEHYPDPVKVLRIAVGLLNPGGTLINRVPTSLGLNLVYWKLINSSRLASFTSVSTEDLTAWYAEVGLKQIETFCLGSFCLNMFPTSAILPSPEWLHRLLVHLPVRLVNLTISTILLGCHALGCTPESKHFSPFVVALGGKAVDQSPCNRPGCERV